jgi:GTP-dependent dephospho-CoA kinase
MTVNYVITPEVLLKFKDPFGMLIQGSFEENMTKLEGIVSKEKPPMIISVGDTVSRNLHKCKIVPQLSITDNKSMRRKLQPEIFPKKSIINVKNPQGTITQEAINAIQEALQSKKQVNIVVDGEEDLLTLIVALNAPLNSLVIYGQPNKGIVVVKVTPQKKAEAEKIWNAVKTGKK